MTRQKILEAAAQIFSQKGYHATSMSDIAGAVNLQKASLYHHVDSKQEILASLLEEALELVINRVSQVLNQPIPADEKLRLAMQTYLETLIEQRDLSAILLLEHRSLDPELRSRHLPRRDRFEHIWRELLQGGIDEGIFRIEDVPVATRGLMGIMNWVVTWFRGDGALTIADISDQFADLVLKGMVIREGGHGT
jgi:AcrR family transcriptional regulator